MTKKSIRSRIKITKGGKMLRRKRGQSHSRALKSRQLIRRRRTIAEVSGVNKKSIIKQFRMKV